MSWGVYVHVPWCRARCPYCHFDIVPQAARPDADAYVARVIEEYATRAVEAPGPPDTVFFGGGTPSRLDGAAFRAILDAIGPARGAEISVEANPEDVDADWLEGARQAGVDRVSLGVQSFVPSVARCLGRGHSAPQAEQALARLAEADLRSWSIDLIFAVPGQSLDDFRSDLDRVTALGVPHVSLYGLTIEPGTAFARAAARGRQMSVDDEIWRAMYDAATDALGDDYERYEVSTFARPGHRCVHNQLYWTDRPYLGLGPGAHGYGFDGARCKNPAALDDWLVAPFAAGAHPTSEEAAIDQLVGGLRFVDGLPLARLGSTGLAPAPAVVARLIRAGGLVDRADRLQLTDAGMPVADGIVGRLVEALQPVGSKP
ncbi:MAG: radical SAM family heme chaperone HemW [Myxococcota bacterium]